MNDYDQEAAYIETLRQELADFDGEEALFNRTCDYYDIPTLLERQRKESENIGDLDLSDLPF